jgi:hypothetical protein
VRGTRVNRTWNVFINVNCNIMIVYIFAIFLTIDAMRNVKFKESFSIVWPRSLGSPSSNIAAAEFQDKAWMLNAPSVF